MDQIGLCRIQLLYLVREILIMNIDVYGIFDVTCRYLLGCAHVENDDFLSLFREYFIGPGGIEIHDF